MPEIMRQRWEPAEPVELSVDLDAKPRSILISRLERAVGPVQNRRCAKPEP
jgi:hypothetical protein